MTFHEVVISQRGQREMKKWVNSTRKSTLSLQNPESSQWQITSQQYVTGVGGYPEILGRIKSEWVGALNRKRWAHQPGIRMLEDYLGLAQENDRLRRENRILKEEREILKNRSGLGPACAQYKQLVLSLPLFISFIAKIARKRPELKRDKTRGGQMKGVPCFMSYRHW
jgi:hypothetical protein